MKRTPLTRKTPLKATTIRASGKRPKMTPARKAARGEDCTVRLDGCKNDTETVVLCHLRMFSGGGTALKPHDSEGVFACSYCHDRIDGRAPLWLPEGESIHEYIARALIRTLRIQREKGVLIYKGDGE